MVLITKGCILSLLFVFQSLCCSRLSVQKRILNLYSFLFLDCEVYPRHHGESEDAEEVRCNVSAKSGRNQSDSRVFEGNGLTHVAQNIRIGILCTCINFHKRRFGKIVFLTAPFTGYNGLSIFLFL